MSAAQVCETDTDVQAALAGWARWLPGMTAPVLPRRPSPLAAAWARASPSKPPSLPPVSATEHPASHTTPAAAVVPPPDAKPSADPVSALPEGDKGGGMVSQQHQEDADRQAKPQLARQAPGGGPAPERGTGASAFSQLMQAARTKAPAPHASGRQDRFVGSAAMCL